MKIEGHKYYCLYEDVLDFLYLLNDEIYEYKLHVSLLSPSFNFREDEKDIYIGLEWNFEKSNLIIEFSCTSNIEVSYLDKKNKQTTFFQKTTGVSPKLLAILKTVSAEETLTA